MVLQEELEAKEKQRDTILDIRKELKDVKNFSIENLNDIAYRVKTKKKLKRLHIITLILGILLEIIETGSFVFGIVKGVWWPFIIGLTIVVILSVVMVKYYYDNVAYICPECHEVFRPKFGQFFWAGHTPSTRKLTCTKCGYRGYCVETYYEKEQQIS